MCRCPVALVMAVILLPLTGGAASRQNEEAESAVARLPRPTPEQAAWHDLELGMFIYFAPNTWQDREYDDLSTPLREINPERLDTDKWVDVAESMGAKYIIFVAKHVGGFCWWQTDTTGYSVRNIPWKNGEGDVLADLAASCRKRGMKLGVYLSPADRTHGVGVGGRADDPGRQKAYESLFRRQLTEILSRYGEMMEVWFDGSLVFGVGDILAEHAPNAVVFQGPQASIRWVGNEAGVAPYPAWNGARFDPETWGKLTAAEDDPDGDRWLPNECDARIRNTWFWRTDNARTLRSVDELMGMYERSVGRGAVLLLNHAPDRTGRIPAADAARAAEFGREIRRRYGVPVIDTAGRGAAVEMILSAPREVDAIISMEDITFGERVRAYVIEGHVDGRWKELARGSAIGHKRIDRFPPSTVSAVRLRVTESVGEPIIRCFAAFDTSRP
ncbi:MAG: alpha-L-fucosidase [Planctomycetota bacterium]|nr:alpha-L-fucosidase [Planctomycetota bacterium]